MKFQNKAILSLGSNTGNRLQNIQDCITNIHNHIATVVRVSGIYETPAWGFEGDAFYNCALLVHTTKTPKQLLKAVLKAEKEGGRVRPSGGGYASRSIDVDIIAFNDEVITDIHLQVPHPRMEQRNFVLYPVRDVMPQWQHPVLLKNINDLIENTPDTSECTFVMKLPSPLESTDFTALHYIAIEGNIGAGKTSMAGRLSEDFDARLVLERFADNPFLPKFYKDRARYAFSLEMSFLADRYQQLTDDLGQFNLASDFVVADYHIVKSLIFSKVTLAEEEYRLYHKLFAIMYKEMHKPGLYVYLYQSAERLLQNIKKRGRSYEQEIKEDYLESINNGYLEYIKHQSGLKILMLDMTHRDFVNSQEDYLWVLQQIEAAVLQS